MNNKELEASFRKAKALGDDIREMESIDALAAYRQSQMKIEAEKNETAQSTDTLCCISGHTVAIGFIDFGIFIFCRVGRRNKIRRSYFYHGNGGAL